jgi:hypothetical protein
MLASFKITLCRLGLGDFAGLFQQCLIAMSMNGATGA